jgi:hypothetical protein
MSRDIDLTDDGEDEVPGDVDLGGDGDDELSGDVDLTRWSARVRMR